MPTQPAAAAGFKALRQIRRAGEQGCRVAVIAHAQYHGIEGARHPRKCLPRGHGAEIRRGRAVLQARGSAPPRHDLAAAPRAPGVRCWRHPRVDPALIGERDADAAPVERLRAQDLEQSHRRSAAGDDQACEPARGDGRGESRARFARELARQRVHVGVALHGCFRVHHATQIRRARSWRSRRPVPSCPRYSSSAARRIAPSRRGSGRSSPKRRRVRLCA